MKMLLLGVGLQGKTVLHDLASQPDVRQVIAADQDVDAVRTFLADKPYAERVRVEQVDATDPKRLADLMDCRPDVVVDLLPVPLHEKVTEAAVASGIHLVTASYVGPEMKRLANEARQKKIALLPEMGMDPGLDLILLGEAVRSLDSVEEIVSYGAGFPEPSAADNPIKYKVTWNFEGVLRSYHRPARLIENGRIVRIDENELFHPDHIHEIDIDDLGTLEAFPNGDAIVYLDLLGLEKEGIQKLARYVLRWPGHAALWKKFVDLKMLDDDTFTIDGVEIDKKRFFAKALEPLLQYKENERDVVVVRVEATGIKQGKPHRIVHQIIDCRDLSTGFTAMSRTVGFTASIGASMIADGTISGRGLLSPIKDVPFDAFKDALQERGIRIHRKVEAL